MEHDPSRFLTVLVEEPFEDVNDEFHGGVIVVQHQNLVHRRLLRLRFGLDDNSRRRTFGPVSFLNVAHAEPVGRENPRGNKETDRS